MQEGSEDLGEKGRESEKINEKRDLEWEMEGRFGKIDRKELMCR